LTRNEKFSVIWKFPKSFYMLHTQIVIPSEQGYRDIILVLREEFA